MELAGVHALAERSEAEYRIRLHERASAPVREALGMDGVRIGGGVALSVCNAPSGAWNRALGLGISEPLTSGLLDEVCGFFVSSGARSASIQVAPQFLPAQWDQFASRCGLVDTGSATLKLAADLSAIPAPPPAPPALLRIAPVASERVQEAVDVLLRGIGLSADGLVDMLAGSIDGSSSTVWAAWAGEQIVASSMFWIDQEVAYFAGMATLAEHRSQGAQSGLIAAQMRAAAEAGCRWTFVDVLAPPPGGTNTSLSNFRRLGFEPLHPRVNWRWSPVSSGPEPR